MSSLKNATPQIPQHYGDETRIPEQMGTYIACLIIAYTGVVLRFVSRHIKRTELKADDWLIVVSLVRPECSRMNQSFTSDSDCRTVLHNRLYRHQYKLDARRPRPAREPHHKCQILCSGTTVASAKWSVRKLTAGT